MRFLLLGLIACAIVCGCIGQIPAAGQPGLAEQGARDVSVTINLPDSIETGKLLVGNYIVNCTEPKFNLSNPDALAKTPNLYVIQTCGLGQQVNCDSDMIIFSRLFCNRAIPFSACRIDRNTTSHCSFYTFTNPGTYTYKVAVFDCSDITNKLGGNCSSANQGTVIQNIAPIATGEKTITVTGNQTGDLCRYGSDDCPSCEGCETGRETCSMYGHVCMQCSIKSFLPLHVREGGCKEGYECRNYVCVKSS
jgi:hypothetical protein